jgi:hypothetical protein
MQSLKTLLVLVGLMGIISVAGAQTMEGNNTSVGGSSAISLSTINQGLITAYHLNSTITGRGVCIQMLPAIPGTGWACVWAANPLYNQITNLLLENFQHRTKTQIEWVIYTGGYPDIRMVYGLW